ncbi:MAG: hypothetical protein F2845_00265 [Actinobacteria bacterium]|nr:hypothetical protein [Actinomycetota bacterium]MSW25673.1 hypothetical protein [Actinomycetota bacterium]MSW33405.1 hypothetical protein [Actinomycetota bacterium]MSX30429.1 hypothetical protein [Actinomycetota bacterium]MSX51339.1 hypothetical protein [Actinomycetota bacterium]
MLLKVRRQNMKCNKQAKRNSGRANLRISFQGQN